MFQFTCGEFCKIGVNFYREEQVGSSFDLIFYKRIIW